MESLLKRTRSFIIMPGRCINCLIGTSMIFWLVCRFILVVPVPVQLLDGLVRAAKILGKLCALAWQSWCLWWLNAHPSYTSSPFLSEEVTGFMFEFSFPCGLVFELGWAVLTGDPTINDIKQALPTKNEKIVHLEGRVSIAQMAVWTFLETAEDYFCDLCASQNFQPATKASKSFSESFFWSLEASKELGQRQSPNLERQLEELQSSSDSIKQYWAYFMENKNHLGGQ